MSTPPSPSAPSTRRAPRIEVRRFAGTDEHAKRLSHLRVAHLTDMHFGRVTPMAVQHRAVELTNAATPDLVVITGDFVCHTQLYLDAMMEALSKLDAPVIAVLGNHDYWSGAREVERALTRGGIEVLKNQHTVITLRRQQLQVVGLDDAYTGNADRERAVRGLRRDIASIGLSHIAEEADGLWHHGVPLVLAGHTHAGQVTLARLHELALGRFVGHRYVHGLYGRRRRPSESEPTGAVYVGAGIGAAVMPLRLGERGRRELALFELGEDLPAFDEHHTEQEAHAGRKPTPEKVAKRQSYVARKELAREIAAARKYVEEMRKRGDSSWPPADLGSERLGPP